MGKLINADKLLENQYRFDDSATLSTRDVVDVEDIEDAPTVEAIPRERIEQMVAEILMKDFDRVTCGEDTLTPRDCVAIIRKYAKECLNKCIEWEIIDQEQPKDPLTQTVSDSLVAFSKQIVKDHEKEQNND